MPIILSWTETLHHLEFRKDGSLFLNKSLVLYHSHEEQSSSQNTDAVPTLSFSFNWLFTAELLELRLVSGRSFYLQYQKVKVLVNK